MDDALFIRQVSIKNFKSIAAARVRLEPLTILVGPNGSGKSNFLDALRFVSDGLRTSLEHALRERGGINDVRRRSGGHPTHIALRFDFVLRDGKQGHYAFEIGARPDGAFAVAKEECEVAGALSRDRFRVQNGAVEGTSKVWPPVARDRLYLLYAGGLPEFRPVYDAFAGMGFYNLNPDRMRELQNPDAADLLHRDGGNAASVLGSIAKKHPDVKQRIEEYLEQLVPGLKGVDAKALGPKETFQFRQEVGGQTHPWTFPGASMSDGTLRGLGILLALFQAFNGAAPAISLIGIEEPEIALHPGAAGILFDSLREASQRVQVLVTSHSADLLDAPGIAAESILAVAMERGNTLIGPLDAKGREALRRRLYTPGELLRQRRLNPEAMPTAQAEQLRFFGPSEP